MERITGARGMVNIVLPPANRDQGLVSSLVSVIAFPAAVTLRSNRSRISARQADFVAAGE
jgi:hypothetical protein